MRHAAKRDAVEPELIALARRLGAKLWMSPPFDWWLLHHAYGYIPVEVKDPSVEGHADEYTPAQKRFMRFARENGGKWLVWRTESDVLKDLGARVGA